MSYLWTPAEVELLRLKYADTPPAEISRLLGRSLPGVHKKADVLGLKKSAAYMARMYETRGTKPCKERMALIDKIRHLLDRPTGVSMREAHTAVGGSISAVGSMMQVAKRAGDLHRIGASRHSRYFLTAQAAAAGVPLIKAEMLRLRVVGRKQTVAARCAREKQARAAARALRIAAKPVKVRVAKVAKPPKALIPVKAKPAPAAPVDARKKVVVAFKAQTAANPNKVKVQILPGIERIYNKPGERVIGGYGTMGIGKYPAECSTWVSAVTGREARPA